MYKLELLCIKYIPILIAAITLINTILCYFDIKCNIVDYVAGTSILTIIPMYISSYVYKFCEYHRIFIHYIVVSKIVAILDFKILLLPLIIIGVLAFLILYYHQKYGRRKE